MAWDRQKLEKLRCHHEQMIELFLLPPFVKGGYGYVTCLSNKARRTLVKESGSEVHEIPALADRVKGEEREPSEFRIKEDGENEVVTCVLSPR